jgi:hypothetical protein
VEAVGGGWLIAVLGTLLGPEGTTSRWWGGCLGCGWRGLAAKLRSCCGGGSPGGGVLLVVWGWVVVVGLRLVCCLRFA